MLNPALKLSNSDRTPDDTVTMIERDFAKVYERHKQVVYRYMLARTGNVQDAHDLTAQSFLAAFRRWDDFDHQVPALHWLMSIARRKAADYYRRQQDDVQLTEALNLPTPAPMPEDMVAHKLKLERVAQAMQLLSEDRQEVLALRLFAAMSNAEVAELLNKSPEAVAMTVNRAIKDLRIRLGENDV